MVIGVTNNFVLINIKIPKLIKIFIYINLKVIKTI